MNIIVYDDNKIKYFEGEIINVEYDPGLIETTICGGFERTFVKGLNEHYTFYAKAKAKETIKLDDTMMKRIAKYNKEKEVMEIEEKILDKKAELEKLTDLIEDREKRVEKLKEFIANLYELDLEKDYDDCWED